MDKLKRPAIDPADVPEVTATGYPEPFRQRVAGRHRRRLGDAAGLNNFGVNLTTLDPGSHSALRHWHKTQDEFIYVLEGEITLLSDAGRQILKPGMSAGFPAGVGDGHCLVNETDRPVRYLEVGDRTPNDAASYPDDDMAGHMVDGKMVFTRKDGTPHS
jgi:uncharacterized cupin superfamily protein